MSDNLSTETQWPSWKVALAIGIPVTIVGVGIYYFYTNAKTKSKSESTNPQLKRTEPEGSSPEKVGVESPKLEIKKPQTKLEEAQDFKSQGNRLFKQGLYDDAIKKYLESIKVCPDERKSEKATYHQNIAAAMEKQQRWNDVIVECSTAIDLNQKYVKALYRRAKAYDKIGKKECSLEDITTVCILEGFQNSITMMFADQVLKELGKEKASEKFKNRKPILPSELFIRQYFASFADDEILFPLTDEMKLMESSSGYIRAKMMFDNQRYTYVIRECTDEIESTKERGDETTGENDKETRSYRMEALLLRGTLHMLCGSVDQARKDLEEVINSEDSRIKLKANALIKRGSMNMQQQRSDKAQEDFNFAISIDPCNCDVYHHRGQLNILLDRGEEALKDFTRCIELKPDFAVAHAQQCYTKYRQAVGSKDKAAIEEAMREFESIIEKYPECSETYGLYAQAQTDKDNFEKADQLFQQATEVDSDNATLYVHRGLLALQWKQDLDLAVKFIDEALKIDDKCDFAHETMGTIEVQRGNLEKAATHFEKSIDLAKTEVELAHLYALQAAAVAQANIASKYGLRAPSQPPF